MTTSARSTANRTRLLAIDVVVKLALVVLLAFGAFSGLERFEGKAFGWRLVGYSIATVVVPTIWAARGRRPPYPYVADTLFVAPFLVDTIGNALDLYDTIEWWDDANHFWNWALLCGACAAALLRTRVRALELFALVVGFARWLRSAGRSASTSRSSATRRSSRPPTRTPSVT